MNRFVRRSTLKYSRMGRGRPKLQRWRAAVGRHSKIRKNRFGYTKSPRIGFKSARTEAGRVNGKMPLLVSNLHDLGKATKDHGIIIARAVGTKKKIELIKKATELHLPILNVRGGSHGLT